MARPLRRILATLSIASLAFLPSVATAQTLPELPIESGSTTTSDTAELRAFLTQWGVNPETQTHLLEKYASGIPWDSMTGASPVLVEEQVGVRATTTIERYSDGSVAVTTIDNPQANGNPLLRGISSCRTAYSNHYEVKHVGCYGNVDIGVGQMGFHFDRVSNPGTLARITNYYGMQHRVVGGSLSNHRLEQFSAQRVRYSADLSAAFQGAPLGGTVWMEVHVGYGTSAWTRHSW